MTNHTFYEVECVVLTALVASFGLGWLVRTLSRGRPGLRLAAPIATAFGLRILAAGAVSQLGIASTLRGGDETIFTQLGREISQTAVGSQKWSEALTSGLDLGGLHEVVFAAQYKLIDSPEFALRIAQAAIAVAGLTLLAAAVCELAGPRPAMAAAWLLALEPSSVFFSTLLHKEALVMLAEGLVVYGDARLWRRGALTALLPVALGCAVALTTRPYLGWFLAAAGAAITLHAALRVRARNETAALALASLVVLGVAVSGSFIWSQSSPDALQQLQTSQVANATDKSNLQLEQVNYSTRADIVLNLPGRVRDILFRPYPWQLGNVSQQLGALGSVFALAVMALVALAVWRCRGTVMDRAGPLVYVTLAELVGYALSVGNAGTGFRYRTHLVALGICLLMALREQRAEVAVAEPLPSVGEPVPVPS